MEIIRAWIVGSARWQNLRARCQSGSSNAVAVLLMVPILLLLAGLVIDYGVKVSAESDAYADAQSVARIAADAGTYGHHGGVDSTRAVAEGRQALAAANLNGDVWVEGEMVHVRTSKTAKTYFLGIVGLSQVTGTAEASSRMVTSDNR